MYRLTLFHFTCLFSLLHWNWTIPVIKISACDVVAKSYLGLTKGRDVAHHAETLSGRHNWYVNQKDLLVLNTYMKPPSSRHSSDVIAGTLMRLNHQRGRKHVLPSTQKKLTHFTDQFEHPESCWDIIITSQLVRQYKTDSFEPFLGCPIGV